MASASGDSMAVACPRCFKDDLANAREWRLHMSSRHGGYTPEDVQKAGITGDTETTVGARDVLDNISDATRKAPTTTKAKRVAASDVIGKILLRKAARLPYKIWAMVLADPRMDLTKDEQAELLSIYMEIAQGAGADFSGPKWAVLAVIMTNADMIFYRLKLRGFRIPFLEDDEEAEAPEQVTQ